MKPVFKPLTGAPRLSDQIAEQIEARIRKRAWKPGDKLPTESELVEQFGVSRTVVREAVARLKSIGLVDARQGSGVFVCEQQAFEPLNFDARHAETQEAVLQIVEIRRALETECASLAAQRRSAAQLQAIRTALAAIEKAVRAGRDGVEEDVRFHQAIAEAACNPFLLSTMNYLAQFHRLGTQVTRANEARTPRFSEQVHAEHQMLVDAIAAQDEKAARRAAEKHMKNAAIRIRKADPAFWQQEGHALASNLLDAQHKHGRKRPVG